MCEGGSKVCLNKGSHLITNIENILKKFINILLKTQVLMNKGPFNFQEDYEFYYFNQHFGIMIASFAQMCFLDWIISQVRGVAHGPLVI